MGKAYVYALSHGIAAVQRTAYGIAFPPAADAAAAAAPAAALPAQDAPEQADAPAAATAAPLERLPMPVRILLLAGLQRAKQPLSWHAPPLL